MCLSVYTNNMAHHISLLAIATLVVAIITTEASEFPTCTISSNSTCYSDGPSPRAVSYLVTPTGNSQLTIDSCAELCYTSGFTVLAVTGNPTTAYCYCGLSINANASVAPEKSCNQTCPGDKSEICGGNGVSSVHTITCDGPLPPPPVGPPLPVGKSCTQPGSEAFGFCNTSWTLEERVQDLVSRVTLPEIASNLMARSSQAIPRLGINEFYWGTNAIHGVVGAPCFTNIPINATYNRSFACATSFPDGAAMSATWNKTAWRVMGATTAKELRAVTNAYWSLQSSPGGGLSSWGPTINLAGKCVFNWLDLLFFPIHPLLVCFKLKKPRIPLLNLYISCAGIRASQWNRCTTQ